MKNFFQKNGIMMLAAVTVVAVPSVCGLRSQAPRPAFLQNAGGVIASPFRGGRLCCQWGGSAP